MEVTLVHVQVKREHLEEFIAETLENHEGSIREPGNLRFDVLQSEEDPTRFVLFEVFRSARDVASHKETSHYLRWRDAVGGWMASPRKGERHRLLAPKDAAEW